MNTSVVVLTKNSSSTIKETLESIMSYYKNSFITEIIIVDGNSTDGTLDLARQYPIRLFFEDKDKPFPAAAREIGWRNASGELILFLDSDGSLSEGFFPRVHEFFSDSKVGLLGCEDKTVVDNSISKTNAQEREFLYRSNRFYPSLLISSYRWFQGIPKKIAIGGACHVVRRSCLESIGGFPLQDCGEDISLAEKIVEAGWKNLWWTNAPIYHRLPNTLRGLLKQYYRHGRQWATWQRKVKGLPRLNLLLDPQHIVSILLRLTSPYFAAILAIYFHNPRHLITYPLCRYAWLTGYTKFFFKN